MLPIRPIEDDDISHNTEQDPQYLIQGSSTLSTTNNTIPQPPIWRNYDQPPLPGSDTYTSSSTSQQPSSSNTYINGLRSNTRPRFIFQTPTPERTSVTTHRYTQAQITSEPHISTIFNINMMHTNPPPSIVTSRTLSRPPLQIILNNPLQYNLSSTNTHNTQHTIHSLEQNAQIKTSNNFG